MCGHAREPQTLDDGGGYQKINSTFRINAEYPEKYPRTYARAKGIRVREKRVKDNPR